VMVRLSIKTKVALLVAALVALVIATLWAANKYYIRDALVAQRRVQISRLFSDQARLFNQLSHERAQLAGSAARAGETMARLRRLEQLPWLDVEWDAFISQDLKGELQRFPGAVKLGVWFEPFAFSPKERYRGYSATLSPEGVRVVVETGTSSKAAQIGRSVSSKSAGALMTKEGSVGPPPVLYDYHTERWYSSLVPERDPQGHPTRPGGMKEEMWYGPHGDEAGLLLTVSRLMVDDDGAVLGVATADWDLHHLVADIENFQPTSTSQAFLIDPRTTTFAAVASRQDLAHRDVGAVAWGTFALRLPDDEESVDLALATGVRWVHKVTLENGLVFGLLVPEAEVLGPIPEIERFLVMMGAVTVVATLLLAFSVTAYLFRPLRKVARATRHLAEGDFATPLPENQGDEVNHLVAELQKVVRYFHHIEEALEALSQGRTDNAIAPWGPADTLSASLSSLNGTIKMLTDDLRLKFLRLGAGDRHDPKWQRQYTGVWRSLVDDVNGFADQFVRPLSEVSAVLDRIAAGEIDARLDGPYMGEFAALQHSLNMALDRQQRLIESHGALLPPGSRLPLSFEQHPGVSNGAPLVKPDRTDLQQMNVLLVQDDPVEQATITRLLAELGCSVSTAADAADALTRLSEEIFDLVVLESGQHATSEEDACKLIRSGGPRNLEVPIVAIGSNQEPEKQARVFEAGASHYLVKPYSQGAFVNAVRRFSRR
jgi:CheY-like chemotaxis protein